MKKAKTYFLFILLLSILSCQKTTIQTSNSQSSEQNRHSKPYVANHIKIHENQEWPLEKDIIAKAKKIEFTFLDSTSDQPEQKTDAYIFTYKNYLGFFIKCYDNDMEHLIYSHTTRDDALWHDDNIEINLTTNPSTVENALQITVNPIGAFSDAKGKMGNSWNADISVDTKTLNNRWEVMALIPIDAISKEPTELQNLKGNISRSRYGRKHTSAEDTAWEKTYSLRANKPEYYHLIQVDPQVLSYIQKEKTLVDLPNTPDTDPKLQQHLSNKINNQVALVNHTKDPIIVDGKLDESIWQSQKNNFLKTQDHRENLNLQDSYFKIIYTDTNLYIGIVCMDTLMPNLAETVTEDNTDFKNDDVIEFFLNPNRYSSSNYIHGIINPANAKYLMINRGRKGSNIGYETLLQNIKTAVSKTDQCWILEIAIPLTNWNLTSSLPSEWGFNLTRYRPQKLGIPSQTSSWSDLLSIDFHQPGKFGLLWLKGKNQVSQTFADKVAKTTIKPEVHIENKVFFSDRNFDFLNTFLEDHIIQQMTISTFDQVRDQQILKRNQDLEAIQNKGDLLAKQDQMRKNFIKNIGGFPEKTPLNILKTKVFTSEQYELYNIIFESMPKHYVTGNLYLPKNIKEKKIPAIIRVVGHATAGKNTTNVFLHNEHLVRQGYAVLAIDSLGQGERIYVNQGKGSRTPTSNHYAIGAACILLGQNIAKYFIWDAIRAIDVLYTESSIDSQKILITGESGGGTLTSYVAALDTRIAGAVSCSAMGSDDKGRGGHDSEQQLANCYAEGFDSTSRAILIAPRPYAIVGEYGSEEQLTRNYQMKDQVKKAYKLLDAESNFEYYPTKEPHGYGKNHRKIFYQWLEKKFPVEQPFSMQEKPAIFKDLDALRASKTWYAYFSRDLKDRTTIHQMNQKIYQQSSVKECSLLAPDMIRTTLASALNIQQGEVPTTPFKITKEESLTENIVLEKAFIPVSKTLFLPMLLVHKKNSSSENIIIWISQRGKSTTLKSRFETIQTLLETNRTVCLPDIRGVGELSKDDLINHFSFDTDLAFYSTRVGKNYLGRMVVDLWTIFKSLQQANPNSKIKIIGDSFAKTNPAHIRQDRLLIDNGIEDLQIAESTVPLACLFFMALETECAQGLINGALSSYESIFDDFYFYHPVSSFAHNIASGIDIPEICLAITPQRLMLCNTVNGKNQLLSTSKTETNKYQKIEKSAKAMTFQLTEGDVSQKIKDFFHP